MIRKLMLAAPVLFFAAPAMAEPVLRDEIVVKGPLVTLGDIFENAGAVAGKAVFRSPEIGTEGAVGAMRVQSAARGHGLHWPNEREIEQVRVRRASRVLKLEDVERLVREGAAAKLSVEEPASIEISFGPGARDMHLDPALNGEIVLSRLDLSGSGAFRAEFGVAGRGEDKTLSFTGQAKETIMLPAPSRDIARGEALLPGDIVMTRVDKGRSISGYVADARGLQGMAARQPLAAGKPVREADIEHPRIVEKNAVVTIVYEAPGLLVKAQGKTLGEAALGESVSVVNTQSKRIVQAIATAPGVVSVRPERAPGPQAAAAPSHAIR
jgi:flagella basal body P-ring formation protein FlgA